MGQEGTGSSGWVGFTEVVEGSFVGEVMRCDLLRIEWMKDMIRMVEGLEIINNETERS